MIVLAMLLYIGLSISAPTWYWVCWGILTLCQIIKLMHKMYKLGKKENAKEGSK